MKQLISKLYRLPRKIGMKNYDLWNRVKFWINGIECCTGMKVCNVVYLTNHSETHMKIE